MHYLVDLLRNNLTTITRSVHIKIRTRAADLNYAAFSKDQIDPLRNVRGEQMLDYLINFGAL
jgi:hypothetical protein